VTKVYIISYIVFLRHQRKVSYSYRNLALSAIRHFYEMNDVEIAGMRKVSKFLGERTKQNSNDRAYEHNEIKKMLDVADIKFKALILTFTSTGIRREDLCKSD
jgi:integrase